METVFSTKEMDPIKRFSAWQEAICEHYLNVDVSSDDPINYNGFLEKSVVGPTILTDVYLSRQEIFRRNNHIAHLDKEVIYLMFPSKGTLLVEQSGEEKLSTPGTAVLFDSTKPYHLTCRYHCQSVYVEVPRSMLAERCSNDIISKPISLNFSAGLGWALITFCKLIANDSDSLNKEVASKIASELTDLLAVYIDAETRHRSSYKQISKNFRFQSIKSFIDGRLNDPDLTPAKIAKANGISLRYLHYLFESSGISVSEWVREQRLIKCQQKLVSDKFGSDSITDIAFSMGFNSSSHFSRLFKKRFGMAPRSFRSIGKSDS
jgi:AraC-like DNA-binding protein